MVLQNEVDRNQGLNKKINGKRRIDKLELFREIFFLENNKKQIK